MIALVLIKVTDNDNSTEAIDRRVSLKVVMHTRVSDSERCDVNIFITHDVKRKVLRY